MKTELQKVAQERKEDQLIQGREIRESISKGGTVAYLAQRYEKCRRINAVLENVLIPAVDGIPEKDAKMKLEAELESFKNRLLWSYQNAKPIGSEQEAYFSLIRIVERILDKS